MFLLFGLESRFVLDFGLNYLAVNVNLFDHHRSAFAPPIILLLDLDG